LYGNRTRVSASAAGAVSDYTPRPNIKSPGIAAGAFSSHVWAVLHSYDWRGAPPAVTDLNVFYLASWSDMTPNFASRLPPRPFTTAMIASEMLAAMIQYSMAVESDSHFRSLRRFSI